MSQASKRTPFKMHDSNTVACIRHCRKTESAVMCRNTASSKIHSVKDADSLCELFLSPNDVPDILHPENVTPSITVFANAERLKSQPVKRQSSRIMPCRSSASAYREVRVLPAP